MWNDRYAHGLSLWGRAAFDPVTMLVGSAAMTAVGTGLSAAGTLAGGKAAQQRGIREKLRLDQQAADYEQQGQIEKEGHEFEARQFEQQGTTEFALAQRRALDRREQTKLALATLKNRAAAGGRSVDFGSTASVADALKSRGEYQALLDMFEGRNAVTGFENRAKAARYAGDVGVYGAGIAARQSREAGFEAMMAGNEAKKASKLSALGTIAGGAGSIFKSFSGPGKK